MVFLNRADVSELIRCPRRNGFAVFGSDQLDGGQGGERGVSGLFGDINRVAEIAIRNVESGALGIFEIGKYLLGEEDRGFVSGEGNPAISGHGFQIKGCFQMRQIASIIGIQPVQKLWGIEFDFEGDGFQNGVWLRRMIKSAGMR
jgi:hypothetical protein